jgi:hypothetical protein
VTPRVDYPKWSTLKATTVWLAVVGLLRGLGMLVGVPDDTQWWYPAVSLGALVVARGVYQRLAIRSCPQCGEPGLGPPPPTAPCA